MNQQRCRTSSAARRGAVPLTLVGLLSAQLMLGSGCSTTSTVLWQKQGVARLKVTSQPPGAPLTLDGQGAGKTPTRLSVPYTLTRKRLHSGARKRAWWALGTGIAALIGGTAMMWWGFSDIGDNTDGEQMGRILTASGGIVVGLYALMGVAGGITGLAVTHTDTEVEVLEPPEVALGANIPTEGPRKALLVPHGDPRLPLAKHHGWVHYSTRRSRWEARLPAGLQLRDADGRPVASGPGPSVARVLGVVGRLPKGARGGLGVLRGRQLPPKDSLRARPRLSSEERDRMEQLRAEGEACYRKRDYACALRHFERAFALAPLAAMRFNLASTLDKLGRTAAAIRQYRRYLHQSADAASPSAVAHIRKRMRALLPQVAQMELTVTPPGASVTVDGVPSTTLEASPARNGRHSLVLAPGSCRVDVTALGHRPQTVQLSLSGGSVETRELHLQPTSGREDEP